MSANNLAKVDFFSEDNAYECRLRSLLSDADVFKWLNDFTQRPLTSCVRLNAGFYFKNEYETPTRTFKFRGACLLLDQLSNIGVKNIVASSTGNHGISLAFIAKQKGLNITVCVPNDTPQEKTRLMLESGAIVRTFGQNLNETMIFAREFAVTSGGLFLSSTDELLAIGHSTLLTEARKQIDSIKRVYFPIGVGSGIAGQIISNLMSDSFVEIIGVVHEKHSSWSVSLDSGVVTEVNCFSSLAPGLKISKPNDDVFSFVQKHIDNIVVINDSDLSEAASFLNSSAVSSSDLTSFASIAAALKMNDHSKDVLVIQC